MRIKDQFNRLLGLEAVNQINTVGIQNEELHRKGNMLLNALNAGLLNRQGVVWLNWSEKDYIKEGYKGNADVYIIINKIVQKLALAPCFLYEEKPDVKSVYKMYNKDSEKSFMYKLYRNKAMDFAPDRGKLQEILKEPNPNQSWAELNILFDIFYFTQGEAFLYRETAIDDDKAISLYVAPANLMNPVFGGDDPANPIIGWELSLPGAPLLRMLDAKDVFQLKMENPEYDVNGSQYRGQSPLVAGLKHLMLSDSALEGFVKLQQNEGVKGIVFNTDQNPDARIPEKLLKPTMEAWDAKINGNEKKGKIVLTNAPLGYINLGVSPEALQIIEAMKYGNTKLCQLWGLSPLLFDAEPKYDNLLEAQRQFVTDVITPYLKKKEEALNRWLVEPFSRFENKKYRLDFDESVYKELAPSREQKEWLKTICTTNEMRIIEGYDIVDNPAYNSVLVQSSMVMLDDLGVDINLDI